MNDQTSRQGFSLHPLEAIKSIEAEWSVAKDQIEQYFRLKASGRENEFDAAGAHLALSAVEKLIGFCRNGLPASPSGIPANAPATAADDDEDEENEVEVKPTPVDDKVLADAKTAAVTPSAPPAVPPKK